MSSTPELIFQDPEFSSTDGAARKVDAISHSWFGPLMAATDFVVLVAIGSLGALWHQRFESAFPPSHPSYFGLGCVVAGLTVALLNARGLYSRSAGPGQDVFVQIVKTWVTVFALLAVAVFLLGLVTNFSRGALVFYFAAGGLALIAIRRVGRVMLRKAMDAGSIRRRGVLLIGDAREVSPARLAEGLRCHGYALSSSFLFDSDRQAEAHAQLPWREIIDAARSGVVDEIMVGVRWSQVAHVEKIVEKLRVLPIPVRLLPDSSMARYIGQPMTDIGLTRTVDLQREPLRYWKRWLKSGLDFVGAAATLVLFSPMLATVALLIKLDSPGPVFFRQTRVGFNGRCFRIYKFRTMTTVEDGAEIRQATRDDERVTSIGKWLRATSVDELPQLINVLLGDMSIVGPRPHAVAHDNQYGDLIDNYALRHRVKPGITGWAQVCGYRGETPTLDLMTRRVDHDLWYIRNWSFWLDTVIVARTAIVLMRPQNVY